MAPFHPFFMAPVWEHALVLLMGAVLAPGKRTVSSALRITGRAAASNFTCYHQVLNRARWSSLAMTRRLLVLIIDRLVPDGPVVSGIGDQRSPPAASTAIRSGRAMPISSRPGACVG